MKAIKRIFVAAIAIVAIAGSANAQFKFGPRVGFNVNSMHFNSDVFKSDNRTGFNAGLQAEFTVPIIGIGVDASLMYVRRNVNFKGEGEGEVASETKHSDYFEIPINLKWKMGIPVISKYLSPYIFTGPSFAFLTSKKAISDAMKYKTVDTSWNIGLGLEFIGHLQVAAYYGFGLNKAIETIKPDLLDSKSIDGKTHCWTVTAAYLF